MQNTPTLVPHPAKRKIILIVRNPENRNGSVAAALETSGHEVLQTSNSVVALEVLKQLLVDLIVSDVDLAHMDGVEFTCHVRALPRFERTPVLLLSPGNKCQTEALGLQAGATAWLEQPFSNHELVEAVVGLLAGATTDPLVSVHPFNPLPANQAGHSAKTFAA